MCKVLWIRYGTHTQGQELVSLHSLLLLLLSSRLTRTSHQSNRTRTPRGPRTETQPETHFSPSCVQFRHPS